MAGRTFVNCADSCVPTFLQSEGVGDDRQKTVAQFEVGRAERIDIRIAGDGVEPEVRRGLARGRAVDVCGAPIGVGGFPVQAITRIRTLQLARDVVTVTAMSVGQQDDAIKVRVAREPAGVSAVKREAGNATEDRASIFGTEAGQDSKVEVAFSHGFQVLSVETFDGCNNSTRQLLIERETAPPDRGRFKIVIVQVDLRRQASAGGARRRWRIEWISFKEARLRR